MNKSLMDTSKSHTAGMTNNNFALANPAPKQPTGLRITQEQLDVLCVRLHTEFAYSFQRTGTDISLTVNDNVITVTIEHALSAAEERLAQHTAGREFFQRYVRELAIQLYAPFIEHIESVLPCAVSFSSVKVDCESRLIVFSFGIRPKIGWSAAVREAKSHQEYYA